MGETIDDMDKEIELRDSTIFFTDKIGNSHEKNM